jgi:hypothetical protein
MATAVEHLVTGETMQFSTSREQRRRLIIYLFYSSNCSSHHIPPKTKGCRIKCLDIFSSLFTLYPPFISMPLFVCSDMILKIVQYGILLAEDILQNSIIDIK